jgi:hypothetical protein
MRCASAITLSVIASLVACSTIAYCSSVAGKASNQKPARVSVSLVNAKVPISFESNIGQFRSGAEYVSRGPGYNLFLTSAEAVFEFKSARGASDPGCGISIDEHAWIPNSPQDRRPPCYNSSFEPVRLRLTGANPEAKPEGRKPLASYSNYLIGNDPSKWRRHVPQFGEVWYSDIYPGIDLMYYGANGQMEYDFVVG